MRNFLLMLLMAAAALSGCLESDEAPQGDAMDDSMEEPMVDAPAPVTFTGSGIGVGDVSSNAPCTADQAACFTHDVEIPNGTWLVTFTLHSHNGTVSGQGVPYGADYELVVLGQESTNPGDQAEVISGVIQGPTTETAEVQTWHDVDGSYELIVTFEAA